MIRPGRYLPAYGASRRPAPTSPSCGRAAAWCRPAPGGKTFRHAAVGEIRMTSVSLSIDGMPDCRTVVYTPDDAESARRTAALRELRPQREIPPS